MKAINVIGVVQLVLILILLTKVVELEQRMRTDIDPTNQTTPAQATITQPMLVPATDNSRVLDEQKLRKIVREELRAQLDGLAISAPRNSNETVLETVSAAEYQYRLEEVSQNLEYYLQQGQISDTDMIRLQTEIAQLDAKGRKQMLSLLTQALNSGELDGHF